MTERFLLTDYEELYYITDSYTLHGDTMDMSQEDLEEYLVENSMTGDEVCNKLNELNKENVILAAVVEKQSRFIKDISQLCQKYNIPLDDLPGVMEEYITNDNIGWSD